MYIYIYCVYIVYIYVDISLIPIYICMYAYCQACWMRDGARARCGWRVCVLLVFILYLRIVFFYGNFAGLICFFSLFLMVFDGEFDI